MTATLTAGRAVHAEQRHMKLRDRVFARDRQRCVYCGSTDELELDFVRPLEGFSSPTAGMFDANAVTACKACRASA